LEAGCYCETFIAPVFGSPRTVKYLEIDGSIVLFEEYWTEEFGKMNRSDFGGLLLALQGCVIDGVVYGDTTFTIVSVEDESETTSSFYLSQNFPNPFNPTTTINCAIKSTGLVTLKVYDILGKEVAELVNEAKDAGNYSVTFNASELPSGIYFYTLTSGNFTATKKLILLR